jgi:transcriptional regulator with XRE-family HTH domain
MDNATKQAQELTLKEFGNRIKVMRTTLNIKQEELASAIGTTQNTISRLENGQGSSIEFFFSVLNFYKQKGIKVYLLLLPTFDINLITSSENTTIEQIQGLMHELLLKINDDFRTIYLLTNTIE